MIIIWFRNDLRLTYNKVLQRAFDLGEKVFPIFILDPKILNSPNLSKKRLAFLAESLVSLDKVLSKYNSSLTILKGNPVKIFNDLIQEHGQIHILLSQDYTVFAQKRDKKISQLIHKSGGIFEQIKNLVVFDNEDQILTKDQNPIKIFTYFKKQWLLKLDSNPNILDFDYNCNELFQSANESTKFFHKIGEKVSQNEISEMIIEISPFHGGEENAQKEWENFIKHKIYNYKNSRDFLSEEGTSKLSPHYKFGTLSIYQAVKFCRTESNIHSKNDGIETYLNELIWREFYKYINAYFPQGEKENLNQKINNIKWRSSPNSFKAWCEGKTGYPIVDACMRCLNQTGWLHNRGRMIVASFLCKDLQIDWRKGEKYFMQKLIDWDKTSNNGGWQWVAGTGTDASPYFRIFNPTLQSERYDPKGIFIKKFIPELREVPEEFIHEPSKMSLVNQKKYNCILGKDYSKPIVNHKEARKITLEIYKGK